MAHALPVIGGAVGGIPEMVVDNETGLLVPPKDPPALAAAVARLVGCGETRRRFGAAARARCERLFSLEAHARTVLQEYERAGAGAASRHRPSAR
jgi:glycosyltransferase involved in cell wall biosynthesis